MQTDATGKTQHLLVRADTGAPFYWAADTAWSLIELPPAKITEYFADRRKRGFNVIQGPILISTDDSTCVTKTGADDSITYSECALQKINNPFPDDGNAATTTACESAGSQIKALNNTIARHEITPTGIVSVAPETGPWNTCFLQFLDFIVDEADRHGLYMAIPFTWGPQADWVFDKSAPSIAQSRANTLATRYKNRSNVMWITMGEFHKAFRDAAGNGPGATLTKSEVEAAYPAEMALIRAIASGLEAGHGGTHLMTIHPTGNATSSTYFHTETWLDFNTSQSGKIDNTDALRVNNDWKLTGPTKPTLDGEAGYESHIYDDGTLVTPQYARYAAYQAVFQGAMGHAYGHWDVWQFSTGWEGALAADAGNDMRYLRSLVNSRPSASRKPRISDLVKNPTGTSYQALNRAIALGGTDNSYGFVYIPKATLSRTVDLTKLGGAGATIRAWWYNPRDGRTYNQAGTWTTSWFATYANTATAQSFNPPGDDATQDWVLVLDVASKDYGQPGGEDGVFQQADGSSALVSIEAEHIQGLRRTSNCGTTQCTWIPVTGADASGAAALQAEPATTSTLAVSDGARLDYRVNFRSSGTHYVWVRGDATSGTDDSVYVGVLNSDGSIASSVPVDLDEAGLWNWTNTHNSTRGRATITVSSTGEQRVAVWTREGKFKLDKLVLTPDVDYIPYAVPTGPEESAFYPQ